MDCRVNPGNPRRLMSREVDVSGPSGNDKVNDGRDTRRAASVQPNVICHVTAGGANAGVPHGKIPAVLGIFPDCACMEGES
jgi:hypothetical protein